MARARREVEPPGHGLEGDFNRKKTSAFAGLMGRAMKVRSCSTSMSAVMVAQPPMRHHYP